MVFRPYHESDWQQVRKFRCANKAEPWGRKPQKDIRKAPELIASGELDAQILVADEDGVVLGVIVIGPDPTGVPDTDYVHTMGVTTERQGQGIAPRLKTYALELAAKVHGHRVVGSEVLCRNTRMRRANEKIGVDTRIDPDDASWLLTQISVEEDTTPDVEDQPGDGEGTD